MPDKELPGQAVVSIKVLAAGTGHPLTRMPVEGEEKYGLARTWTRIQIHHLVRTVFQGCYWPSSRPLWHSPSDGLPPFLANLAKTLYLYGWRPRRRKGRARVVVPQTLRVCTELNLHHEHQEQKKEMVWWPSGPFTSADTSSPSQYSEEDANLLNSIMLLDNFTCAAFFVPLPSIPPLLPDKETTPRIACLLALSTTFQPQCRASRWMKCDSFEYFSLSSSAVSAAHPFLHQHHRLLLPTLTTHYRHLRLKISHRFDDMPSKLPTIPRGLSLLGRDTSKATYHWEGPYRGTVWETFPDQLYGWIKPWTDWEPEADEKMWIEEDKPCHYLINPATQDVRVDPHDEEWAWVLPKTGGAKEGMKIRRSFVFGVRDDVLESTEELRAATSPYAFAAAVLRGEC